ncbi:hypothetical protein CDL15_Pgr023505 [Punica granatum]|uniref:Uncharacterized protein n=1 Tax=Punica granatum TaxID=22663 RepID=A0A218W898_PUNGR|nr:hypothetical protein CDL15_Pgr023505 [Punica granatum]
MGKGLFIGVVGQMMRRWSEVRVEEDECGVDRTLTQKGEAQDYKVKGMRVELAIAVGDEEIG